MRTLGRRSVDIGDQGTVTSESATAETATSETEMSDPAPATSSTNTATVEEAGDDYSPQIDDKPSEEDAPPAYLSVAVAMEELGFTNPLETAGIGESETYDQSADANYRRADISFSPCST